MNWPAIILIVIGASGIIIFLAVRNIKDEKKFENQLKNDYPKPKEDESDIEIDETMK